MAKTRALTGLTFILSCTLLATATLATPAKAAGGPVADPALEQRLVTTRIYRTTRVETFWKLAHLLYGHKTWWTKLRADNPSLAILDAHDRIPKGTEIRYRAPEVGAEYVVQPNDWLIRIAIWKYGETAAWKDLYERNAKVIARPELIHPGDHLYLGAGGTIRLAKANRLTEPKETVFEGENTEAPAYEGDQAQAHDQAQADAEAQARAEAEALAQAQAQAQAAAEAQARAQAEALATQQTARDPAEGVEQASVFNIYWIGAALALILTALGGVGYWRHATAVPYPKRAFGGRESTGSLSGVGTGARPVVYDLDRSLIHHDDVEITDRPGYQSLMKRWKKYLKEIASAFRAKHTRRK